MDNISWQAQVSSREEFTVVVAEYALNEMGVFVKYENRIPKRAPLYKLTGFRIGYKAIPGTDYRAAPAGRNAILWKKITSVTEDGSGNILICGNQKDRIILVFPPEMRDNIVLYIQTMQKLNPPVVEADCDAASWICWRDDDEWEDPFSPISEMIEKELSVERFLEPEVMEETVLEVPLSKTTLANEKQVDVPRFCFKCGSEILPDSRFCENCGAQVQD